MTRETNVIIQPVLHYRDPGEALRFLTEAFGFREHAVHKGPDGKIAYVELEFGGCHFGLGATSEGDSPFDLGPTAVYVALDHPDEHHHQAVAAGAEIVMGLTDQDYGSRDYAARDPEGNVWCFGTYRPDGS
ncbi:MAG TPA: VOC family protein [Acidimicrobiia bacterium]